MTLSKEMELMVQRQAEIAVNTAELINDYMLVKEFMHNRMSEFKLNKRQQELMETYQLIYTDLCSGKYTSAEIAHGLVNRKRANNKRGAERLIEQTRDIYGRILNVNKAFELKVMLEANMRFIIKAENAGDLKEVAALQKLRLDIINSIETIPDTPGEDFTGYTINVDYDPRRLGIEPLDKKAVLKELNERAGVKIGVDWMKGMDVEDIDFENDETENS